MTQARLHRPLIALLVAGMALSAQDQSLGQRRRALPYRTSGHALSGHDRADLRRDWELYWFGGAATPDYLDAKAALAAKELDRWAHLFPGTPKAKSLSPALSGPSWVNLGPKANLTSASFPDMDSGRPVAIVTHPADPKILYLATSGGGVFKCVDADLAATGDWTWTPITDTLPASGTSGNVSVGALAMSPADANTLYLGCGDAFDAEGRGFFKTTDGGGTWTAATGMGSATRTYDILPLSATVVLVGTNDGLKRSTDGGASFSAVSVGGVTTGKVWTVQAFSSTDLICSVQDAGGTGNIYYSSNAGASWTQATLNGITGQARITLASSAASATQAWGIYENASGNIAPGLLKTTDKGQSWTYVAAPTTSGSLFHGIGNQMSGDGGQGFYNHGLAVDPTNINRVFVGANLALYRTEDGGSTWTQFTHWYGNRHVYAHADFHTTSWSKTGSSTLYIGNDGGLCIVRKPAIASASVPTSSSGSVSSDVTFIDNRHNKGLATHLVYNLGSTIATTPTGSRDLVSLGLQDNGTRVRRDTGSGLAASSTFEDGIGGDGFGTVIHPLDGSKVLGTVYYTDVFKSVDSGVSFNESIAGITEANDGNNAPFAPKFALGRADATGNTVYTYTNAKVYKSTDFGSAWTAMGMTGFDSARIIRNVGASATNANTVAVVTSGDGTTGSGSGWVTTNGGTSWSQFGALPNNDRSMSYVWFDTANDQTMYASSAAMGTSLTHLWKSANRGATWTSAEGTNFPSGIPVHVVQNQPGDSNHLFVGTDFGVYHSTNAGASWSRYGSGLPLVAVRDLYIAPDGSFVRAATFGRGVWEIPMAVTASVTVSPSTTQQLDLGASQAFTATVTNFTSNQNVNWSATAGGFSSTSTLGDGVASTTFTAPATPQVVTVTAASAETPSSTASVTVNVYTPSALTVAVSPLTKVLISGGSQTFVATVSGAPSQAVTWSTSAGTIGGGGAFTAPTLTLGTQTITVTATSIYAGPTNTGTATITVKSLDVNGDATVDLKDLAFIANAWGSATSAAKLSDGATVTDTDLQAFLANF